MAQTETILPCEQLLFKSAHFKIGRFDCPADSEWFPCTSPIQNHVFVIARNPLWWKRSEGQFRFAEPGAALFHRAGAETQRRPACAVGDVADWFGIDEALFCEAFERHGLDQRELTIRPRSLITPLGFRHREHRLMARVQDENVSALEIEESTLALLDEICAGFSHSSRPTGSRRALDAQRRLVDRTRDLLNQAACPGRLDEIARTVGSSSYPLCRVFRKHTGMSLHGYQQLTRLARGLEKMSGSRQNLTRLALDLGFSSHSHFTRAFKSQFGLPPSAINGL